jgi:hypothetical protein
MSIEKAANVHPRDDLETKRDVLNEDDLPAAARGFLRTTTSVRISPAALAAALRELRLQRRDRGPFR